VGELRRCGFTLEEIANWTPYQLRMMVAEDKELGGTTKMSQEDAMSLRDRITSERESFVERSLARERAWRGRIGGSC